ncbi:phenylacetate--CoA ligase family protein [Candidatus Omnitrophota bacterium]
MRKILAHAAEKVPYYKEVSQKAGFCSDNIPQNEVKKFPLLDKDIIRQNLPKRIIDKQKDIYKIEHTSGSSGVRGDFYIDRNAYSKILATQLLWWEWAGYRFGDRIMLTGITPNRGLVKSVKDILLRTKYINAFRINSQDIKNNLIPIRGRQDYFFAGYPSSLFAYAHFARENKFNDIKFRSVISWGDKMFAHYRKLVEEQFHTQVFDNYGACEGAMIAGECEYHSYHIMTPHVFIELLDADGNEVDPGEMGEVVVTCLDNFLMPLVRYRIGDLAIRAHPDKKCACGRHLPILKCIIGRDTDIIKTRSGKSLIVHFFTGIFEHIKEVEQFQVIQHTLDDVEICLIPGPDFTESVLGNIKQQIWEKLNEKIDIRFSKVSEVRSSPSGKSQIVISELEKQ